MKQNILSRFRPRRIVDVESVKNSTAFCMKPWVHLFVSQYGTVVPCCLTPWDKDQSLGDINSQSIEEIWQGKQMKAFRSNLLKDLPDARCKQCYESEKHGLKSTRQVTNALYAPQFDWVLSTLRSGEAPEAKPIFLDIRFSNQCNFKCRICGHHSSSLWFNDAKALGMISHEQKMHRGVSDYKGLFAQMAPFMSAIQEVYFAGGEPLIMEEHYYFLQCLLDAGNKEVRLRYATNFSTHTYKGQSIFDLWKHFASVTVHASLDAGKEAGELQRSGQDWQQVLTFKSLLNEHAPHVEFLVTPTISVLNCMSIAAFHRELVESGFCAIDEFMPHTLRGPEELNIRILPTPFKDKVAENLLAHIEWIKNYAQKNPPQTPTNKQGIDLSLFNKPTEVTGHLKLDMVIQEFSSAVTFMQSKDQTDLLPKFRSYMRQLDTLRNESSREALPELREILEGNETN